MVVGLLIAIAPNAARGATEIKLDRDFLAGLVAKLPPVPFDKEGQYRGSVHSFRLAGIDPDQRKLLTAFTAEGEFRPPASGPVSERLSRSDDHVGGLRKFRFEIKASVRVEAGLDGSPRFLVEVDEVKRAELEGVAGLLAKLLGRQFDEIATRVVDGRSAEINQKLNEQIMRRAAMYKDYGVLCGVDYQADSITLRFDLTRLTREGIAGYIFPEPRPGALPLYRWLNTRDGAHLYTLSESPNRPGPYVAEGLAGYVPDASEPGAVPIYGWRAPRNHFYTTDPNVQKVRPRMFQAEGVAFHLLTEPREGAVPFYRFFDPRRGQHFYTTHPHAEFAK